MRFLSTFVPPLFLSTPSARRATFCPCISATLVPLFLSTPSARRATSGEADYTAKRGISIHALREEGDNLSNYQKISLKTFLSTPSARRATARATVRHCWVAYFYPRPPRGGRPDSRRAGFTRTRISIHALREEGDNLTTRACLSVLDFYPRPPRGGRQQCHLPVLRSTEFLSTPSARRATSADRHLGVFC